MNSIFRILLTIYYRKVYIYKCNYNSKFFDCLIKSNSLSMDNSIIDITGESYSISNISKTSNVPFWGHQYVYSYSEINSATNQQRVFYKTFIAHLD